MVCGIILSYGASFLELIVLLVFGYTTAMTTEEYPESWGLNVAVLGALAVGLVMELVLVGLLIGNEVVGWGFELKGSESLDVFGGKECGYILEDSIGVATLYSSGGWLILLVGWMFFVSTFVVIEITSVL